MEKQTVIFSEHKGFYSPTYESPEVVEERKRLLDMQPRKTYKEAKKEFAKRSINSN